MKGYYGSVQDRLCAVESACRAAEAAAGARWGGVFRVDFMLCLDRRHGFVRDRQALRRLLRELARIKREYPALGQRMAGVDLSGKEGSEFAWTTWPGISPGFTPMDSRCVCHLGDTGGNAEPEFKTPGGRIAHLQYVLDTVRILPAGSRVGHMKVLVDGYSQGSRESILADAIIGELRRKNMFCEACPSELDERTRLGFWKSQGISIMLGVDGISYFRDRFRTLSQWCAELCEYGIFTREELDDIVRYGSRSLDGGAGYTSAIDRWKSAIISLGGDGTSVDKYIASLSERSWLNGEGMDKLAEVEASISGQPIDGSSLELSCEIHCFTLAEFRGFPEIKIVSESVNEGYESQDALGTVSLRHVVYRIADCSHVAWPLTRQLTVFAFRQDFLKWLDRIAMLDAYTAAQCLAHTQVIVSVLKSDAAWAAFVGDIRARGVHVALEAAAVRMPRDGGIFLGAQNMYPRDTVCTGEVPTWILKREGVTYVLAGHPDRGESLSFVNEKVLAALASGITPVCFVTDTPEDRTAIRSYRILHDQMDAIFNGVSCADAERVIIVYFPQTEASGDSVCHIPMDPAKAQQVCSFLRLRLSEKFGPDTAGKMRLLYGRGITPRNVSRYAWRSAIDGVFVALLRKRPVMARRSLTWSKLPLSGTGRT
jgi:triosephosphate isomerase